MVWACIVGIFISDEYDDSKLNNDEAAETAERRKALQAINEKYIRKYSGKNRYVKAPPTALKY
jgi:hypothetical protein